jgi:hypothetical protein
VTWSIADTQQVNTSPGRDTTSAKLVHLERGEGETYRITVELSGTASAIGIGLDAREAVQDYLNEDAPPRLLIVTSEGVRPAE